MTRKELLTKIQEICRDVFDDQELVISEATTSADVASWDSLTHLSLINEIEETFHVVFTLDEVTASKNIGELLNAIEKRM